MNPWIERLVGWLRQQWLRLRASRPSKTVTTQPEALPPAPPLRLPSPLVGCATVVIPALNEAARIAEVVRHALSDPATAEVIVVDDSSIDETAERARLAGATVITSTMLGKGASMRDGALLHSTQR